MYSELPLTQPTFGTKGAVATKGIFRVKSNENWNMHVNSHSKMWARVDSRHFICTRSRYLYQWASCMTVSWVSESCEDSHSGTSCCQVRQFLFLQPIKSIDCLLYGPRGTEAAWNYAFAFPTATHTHTYTQLWKKQLRNFTHCETPGKFLWHKENELTVKEAKCLNRNHTSSHLNMQPFRHREAVNNSKEASSHSTSGAMYIPSSESAPFSKRRPRQYKPPLGAIRYSSNHTTCMPFPQRRGVGSSFLKGLYRQQRTPWAKGAMCLKGEALLVGAITH